MLAYAPWRPLSRRIDGVRAALRGVALGFAGVATTGAAVAAPTSCGPHADVLAQLAERFHEAPVAVGLASDGSLVEVLSTNDGAIWTIVVSRPDGLSCLVAAGEAWQELERVALDGPQI